MIRKYSNGYEAHWIDMHPHGKTYRDVHNCLGYIAFPCEEIMLLNNSGVVVIFLESLTDLERIEKELRLNGMSRQEIYSSCKSK